MTQMKLRLDFFLQIFLIILKYIWWSLQPSFLFMGMGKRCRKVICVVKLKVIQPQPKYKTKGFSKFGGINKKLSSRLEDFGH